MKNRLPLLLLFTFMTTISFSQKWKNVENASFRSSDEQRITLPNQYESYELDFDQFRSMLSNAPKRFESVGEGVVIDWPMPGNKLQKFIIKRSDVFHPDLAAKYPEIQAYSGQSLSDPTAILKISISHKGIEGMLLSNRHETVYLDRYLPKSKEKYILYKRSDYQREFEEGEGRCTVEVPDDGYKGIDHSVRYGDCQLRKFRLALACTGEYAAFHGGNVPDVLAEYNASLVRVNGIYERDFAITMELIPNTDQLIFLSAATDPYTNNDGSAMLAQNQSTVDQIIGFSNYDIGHVYSTGGGGIASLRSPCTNRKARGVTGLGNPTGDFFWVDYVAHEMGHQFGGNHTFNNSCDNNRNNNTAIEPGSGSTIMAYAGICSPDVQNNSDDYFHSVSQAEIANFVVAGNGNCAEIIIINNSPPVLESMTATGQILPSRTPFFLTAEASDADNDILTYCWEQIDKEIAEMPPQSDAINGPAFRTFDPTENPTRYFPGLPSILFGINGTTWEVLPNTDREMNFNVTVRDNYPLGGCTDNDDLTVNFTSSAGPFLITSQNTTTSWNAGETKTITWDVANTDMAPVSCANVDIIFSLDRGKNFDIILAENVPNDGEHDIIVPFEFTSQGRIMLKCSSSTFFDINDRDISVIAPFSTEISPSSITVCPAEVAIFMIDYTVLGANPVPVTFAINGLPIGATHTFSPIQTSEDTNVTLTIDDLTSDMSGIYNLEVIVQGEMVTQTLNTTLIVAPDQNNPTVYLSPADGQLGISNAPLLSWQAINGITNYEVEVSENPKFAPVVFSIATNNTFISAFGLNSMTVYYWRARGISHCLTPSWENIQSFQTGGLACNADSVEANIIIADDSGSTIESDIELDTPGILGGLEVSMQIDHTWVGDLSVKLRAPNGQEIKLFEQPGVPASGFGCDGNNIVVTFSSNAINTNEDFDETCSTGEIAIEGIFQPLESFSLLENIPIAGIWTLIVTDIVGPDGGQLVNWSILTCNASPLDPGVLLKNNLLQLSNTTEGNITNSLLEMENIDPVNTRFTLRSIPQYGELEKLNEVSGIFETIELGSTFSQEDVNLDRIKYVLIDISTAVDSFIFDTEDDQSRYTPNNIFLVATNISALSISATITNQISCFGETDGRIVVMGIGGIPGYTFSINDGPFETQNAFENLGAGDYTIILKDDIGTEVSSNVLSIIEPSEVTFDFIVGNNEITINGVGGSGILMYSLNGIDYFTANTLEIFDGEMYRIYVKDENGCLAQSISEMTFYQIGSADITVEYVSCKGESTGSINVNSVSGGLAPYTYQLNEESPITNNTFSNLPAGTYDVTIRDAAGNVYEQFDIQVLESEFILEITAGVAEDFVSLSGSGGTSPYQFSIDGSNFIDDGDFGPLSNGTYTGYIVDANNCLDSIDFVIMVSSTNNPELAQLILSPNPTDANFVLSSIVNFNFEYQILDVSGKTILNNKADSNNPISVAHLLPGLYLVKVTFKDTNRVFKLSKI